MDFTHFYNPAAAVIVFGGTALAAVLRCGLSATVTTGKALTDLFRPRFRADAVRAVLAGQAADIRANGLLRAQPCRSGDREFDEATNAMLSARSVSGLLETHEAFAPRAGRKRARRRGCWRRRPIWHRCSALPERLYR
jgi:chemotaxis protein MotA